MSIKFHKYVYGYAHTHKHTYIYIHTIIIPLYFIVLHAHKYIYTLYIYMCVLLIFMSTDSTFQRQSQLRLRKLRHASVHFVQGSVHAFHLARSSCPRRSIEIPRFLRSMEQQKSIGNHCFSNNCRGFWCRFPRQLIQQRVKNNIYEQFSKLCFYIFLYSKWFCWFRPTCTKPTMCPLSQLGSCSPILI